MALPSIPALQPAGARVQHPVGCGPVDISLGVAAQGDCTVQWRQSGVPSNSYRSASVRVTGEPSRASPTASQSVPSRRGAQPEQVGPETSAHLVRACLSRLSLVCSCVLWILFFLFPRAKPGGTLEPHGAGFSLNWGGPPAVVQPRTARMGGYLESEEVWHTMATGRF